MADPTPATGADLRRIKALERAGDVDGLLAELKSPSEASVSAGGTALTIGLRGRAAQALGRLGDSRALGPLSELLSDPLFTVRQDACIGLGELQDRRAGRVLLAAASDSEWKVRLCAAQALGKIGEPEAVPRLVDLLEDEAWLVRRAAAEALADIGDPAGIEPSQRAVAREKPWHVYRKLRLHAALSKLRTKAGNASDS